MDRVDKIKLGISLVFRMFLVIACLLAIVKADWKDVGLSLLALFLTFLPDIIEKKMHIDYPVDTMWDLIIDALAALVVSFLGYLYLKGNINIFQSIEKKFFSKNPSLLK